MLSRITRKNGPAITLADQAYAFVAGSDIYIPPELRPDYFRFRMDWDQLEPDEYLQSGARFRYRRYNYFYFHPKEDCLLLLPYEPFYQAPEDNDYVGGVYRAFPPLSANTATNPFMQALIRFSFYQMPQAHDPAFLSAPWKVEVHQVRVITTAAEVGQPAPEGIHRDGGESGFVYLMDRKNATGAESLVYDNDRRLLARQALSKPMDAQMFLDPEVLHDVSPLKAVDASKPAIRDVFILGFAYTPELERP